MRFVVEGEWSGYTSAQRRIVHRSVHTRDREKFAALRAIRYSDGTSLILTVRDCKPREKVEEKHGYTSLIADCIRYGVSNVDDLPSD